MKKQTIGLIFLSALGITGIQAQQSNSASGVMASGSGGSVSYSVGQVAYSANTGTNGSVTQGVQQPYEISVVTAIEEASSINLTVSAYPNPTTDYLTLSINDNVKIRHALSQLSYQLYDMNGKLLQNKKFVGSETQIDMSNYVPSTYYVKVIVKTQGFAPQEVKTFQIIKN